MTTTQVTAPSSPRTCAVIPTYNNPMTIGLVVEQVLRFIDTVYVVDDGSAEPGRIAVDALKDTLGVIVVRRAQNGGKGGAVKDGLRAAHAAGFSHALQVDADNQHELSRIPDLLRQSALHPEAVVLAYPVFDETVPKGRLHARKITIFWTTLETFGRSIIDPMCGFRVYPVAATVQVLPKSNYMDFDPELAVRLIWAGTPALNVPTAVRYLTAEQGGVSNFHVFYDNVRISWMHTRLFTLSLFLFLFRPDKILRARRAARALKTRALGHGQLAKSS
jgi:polyprenyl-phospho-N-acetylgalactosaminyl synthase